jgi:hypothetical protein
VLYLRPYVKYLQQTLKKYIQPNFLINIGLFDIIRVVLQKTAHAITLLLMTQMKKIVQETKWL